MNWNVRKLDLLEVIDGSSAIETMTRDFGAALIRDKEDLLRLHLPPSYRHVLGNNRLRCTIANDGVETFYCDDVPFLEIWPPFFDQQIDGDTMKIRGHFKFKDLRGK